MSTAGGLGLRSLTADEDSPGPDCRQSGALAPLGAHYHDLLSMVN